MLFASLTRGSSVAHSKLNIVYERQYPVCHLSFFMHPLDTRRYVYRLSTRENQSTFPRQNDGREGR